MGIIGWGRLCLPKEPGVASPTLHTQAPFEAPPMRWPRLRLGPYSSPSWHSRAGGASLGQRLADAVGGPQGSSRGWGLGQNGPGRGLASPSRQFTRHPWLGSYFNSSNVTMALGRGSLPGSYTGAQVLILFFSVGAPPRVPAPAQPPPPEALPSLLLFLSPLTPSPEVPTARSSPPPRSSSCQPLTDPRPAPGSDWWPALEPQNS